MTVGTPVVETAPPRRRPAARKQLQWTRRRVKGKVTAKRLDKAAAVCFVPAQSSSFKAELILKARYFTRVRCYMPAGLCHTNPKNTEKPFVNMLMRTMTHQRMQQHPLVLWEKWSRPAKRMRALLLYEVAAMVEILSGALSADYSTTSHHVRAE